MSQQTNEFERRNTGEHPIVVIMAGCEAHREAASRAVLSYQARSWESLSEAAAAAAACEFAAAVPTLRGGPAWPAARRAEHGTHRA